MTFICTKCKHPLEILGLSESSYLKCNKCNIIIKKNEIDYNLDHNNIKYMDATGYNEKFHLISVSIKKILNNLNYNNKYLELNTIGELIEIILSSDRIFLSGSGRLKLICSAFCMRLVHLNLESYMLNEYTSPLINEKDCLIVVSKSGETVVDLVNVENANAMGCKTSLLTFNPNSKIAKVSSTVLNLKKIDDSNNLSYIYKNSNQLEITSEDTLFETLISIILDGIIAEIMIKICKHEIDLKNRHFNLEQ
ncbi:MAG: SIS domain-containing protein [Methanobrevibacter sp.]|jgi:6-phospho-3-hexuloisomerase|nr:SIS domain-containing protein [Candidatus Methanovirga australis]